MNEPPPTDFLASAASQQSFEFFMRGLFMFAGVLFTVVLVVMIGLVAVFCWELMRNYREHARDGARLRASGEDFSGASK